MHNPKIEKAAAEIEKTKAKIAELAARLREQERAKTRLENEQIVAIVREERISDAELSSLMGALRRARPPEAEAPAQNTARTEVARNAGGDED
ncbi:MAG: DUF4315 family protein [Clostridiales bacterium]|jgi:hypothetical protein|nr:DUF4315 family protein [Clostridiales bacterium]